MRRWAQEAVENVSDLLFIESGNFLEHSTGLNLIEFLQKYS